MLLYFILFLVSAVFTIGFIIFAKKISFKYGLYDDPVKDSLKIHQKPIPFLGGAAIISSFLLCLAIMWVFKKYINFISELFWMVYSFIIKRVFFLLMILFYSAFSFAGIETENVRSVKFNKMYFVYKKFHLHQKIAK